MKDIRSLEQTLSDNLPWNKAPIKFGGCCGRTRINCPLVVPEARKMCGMELYLSGRRLKDGEYLILVSSGFCEKPHEQ
jgi:hypothetical protein